jgi:hypothetical protein
MDLIKYMINDYFNKGTLIHKGMLFDAYLHLKIFNIKMLACLKRGSNMCQLMCCTKTAFLFCCGTAAQIWPRPARQCSFDRKITWSQRPLHTQYTPTTDEYPCPQQDSNP